ncbi:unnamed protein product [Tuwongella immobilis]|uniref:Uncharacterized protein n=2 Tax=Tuwongella immobilis TaxID=692036 RepID=A0A6C2YK28_9BACT|nr:unnamed protein product [Tuwongella immobilis]VTR98010.1 unnamed protein product [Tuwongella immobilis]
MEDRLDRVICFGYDSTSFPKFYYLPDYINDAPIYPDVAQILQYMRTVPGVCATSDFAFPPQYCPLCGVQMQNIAAQYTDSEWWWFGTVFHYVEFHHARLPEPFVMHIRKLNYQPQPSLEQVREQWTRRRQELEEEMRRQRENSQSDRGDRTETP